MLCNVINEKQTKQKQEQQETKKKKKKKNAKDEIYREKERAKNERGKMPVSASEIERYSEFHGFRLRYREAVAYPEGKLGGSRLFLSQF